MRAGLKHVAPNSPGRGARVVRSAKRARLLRKRGVRLEVFHHTQLEYGAPVRRYWVWYVRETNPTRTTRRWLRHELARRKAQWEQLRARFLYQTPLKPELTAYDRAWAARLRPARAALFEREAAPFLSLPIGAGKAGRLSDATPEQLKAAAAVDMTDFREEMRKRQLAGVTVDGFALIRPYLPTHVALVAKGDPGCSIGPIDQCVNGWLCHNYCPVGEPVDGKQLMRCERQGCNKEHHEDTC